MSFLLTLKTYILTLVAKGDTGVAFGDTRPVGQAVKTPAFHAGNTSSNLVRVTIFFIRAPAVLFQAAHAFQSFQSKNPVTVMVTGFLLCLLTCSESFYNINHHIIYNILFYCKHVYAQREVIIMNDSLEQKKTCETCKHFRLHYIKRGKSYSPLYYGHCVYPRLKKRETETLACEHYYEVKVKTS